MTRRKKILFISNLYPNPFFSSMATFNRQQINALHEHGDIEVIAPISWTALLTRKLKQPSREESGIVIHHPTYYYSPRILRNLYGEFFYHSIRNVALSLLEKKQFDLIYSSWLYPDSWAAAKLAKQYSIPLFVKVHGSDVNRLVPGTTITRRSLAVSEQAEKVICVSKALKTRMMNLGVPEKKLEVLYNGVDQNIFRNLNRNDVRIQLNVNSDDFLVLYVGNLKKEKGLSELIAAFKAVTAEVINKSRLVIIGSGAYEATAKQLVASLNLADNVSFFGNLPLETVARWMKAASVLCLPSYMEGVPNVVIEALSCGTRVVATNVGGIPELDKGDGMMTLVPPHAIAPLAKALSVVARNPCPAETTVFSIESWQANAQKLYSLLLGAP